MLEKHGTKNYRLGEINNCVINNLEIISVLCLQDEQDVKALSYGFGLFRDSGLGDKIHMSTGCRA